MKKVGKGRPTAKHVGNIQSIDPFLPKGIGQQKHEKEKQTRKAAMDEKHHPYRAYFDKKNFISMTRNL